MIFKTVYFKNFRNLQNTKAQFNPNINILFGENGQGKTNILEALYLLSRGTTFRYANTDDLVQYEKPLAWVKAIAVDNDLSFEIDLKIEGNKKSHFLNGKKISASKLAEKFKNVLFSPESLASIKEGGDQRRELIDEVLLNSSTQNLEIISQYRKILRTRNKVLKNYIAEIQNREQTERLLESLNVNFLKYASLLTELRLNTLEALLPHFSQAMRSISNKPDVDISVEYLVSGENMMGQGREIIQKSLSRRLVELHDAELSSGVSLVGPHKHDISFLYSGKDSRIFCSQGQQRALILSFKMAQIVYHRSTYGMYPVLMLDDVLSELDGDKRQSLISFLKDIKTQIFITTTDVTLPQSLGTDDYTVLNVKDGNCV